MYEGGHLADKDDFRKQAALRAARPRASAASLHTRVRPSFVATLPGPRCTLGVGIRMVPMDHDQRIVLHAIFGHPVNSNRRGGRHHVPTGLGAEIDNKTGSQIGVALDGHAGRVPSHQSQSLEWRGAANLQVSPGKAGGFRIGAARSGGRGR